MLKNTDIKKLIASKGLILNHSSKRIEPASYDMVIGTIFRGNEIINASHAKANDAIVIAPGEVVTMLTLEELALPDDIAATAYARNAQSSEGLLVLNPGHVDPGYKGPLTVVALNLRKVPLPLLLDEKIFTVVFEQLDGDSSPPYPRTSLSRSDFERNTHKKVVEKSIGSLAALLSITKKDINAQITKHWLSWVVVGSSVIGMIAAVVAAVFAIVAVFPKSDSNATSTQHSATTQTINTPTVRPNTPSAPSKAPVLPPPPVLETQTKSN